MLRTLHGFRDFVMRGNVVDLAVGIVIGAAFTSVVTTFTGSFVEPLIKVFGGGRSELAGVWSVAGQELRWAAFVNALITFLITAAVLYFLVVLPTNKLATRRAPVEAARPGPNPPSEEVALLREIRDALVELGRTGVDRDQTTPVGPSSPVSPRSRSAR